MIIINHMMFWIAVAFCVISCSRMYLSVKREELNPKEWIVPDRAYRILFVTAVIAAVFVRVWKFGQIPGGFNQDGAMAAVDAKALAEYGTDRFGMRFPVHLTAWEYGQMSSLLSYLMVPFIRMFGFTPFALRLPLLLFSFAGLVCLYGFVRDVFGKNVGLIAFCFGAINPWHILQSRWAMDCNLYAHFFMIGVFLLNRAFKKEKNRGYLLGSMVTFGFCMYCYGISIYTMPLFLLVSCIYLLAARKISVVDAIMALAVYLLTAWPFIAVMAINFFHWDTVETPFFTLPYFSESMRANDILFFSPNILSQLTENFKSLLRATVLQSKDMPWNDMRNYGTMYLFSIPFAVAGGYGLFHEFRRKPGAVLFAVFFGTGIWCGLATNGVNVNRLNIIYYPIIILVAIGMYEVIRWISLPRLEYAMAVVYGMVFLLLVRAYFTSYADDMDLQFRKNFGDALSSVKESDAEKIYITIAGNQNKAVCEILTLFWCEIDAEYFQGKAIPEGQLPYSEKYVYHGINEIMVDPVENNAYIVVGEELELFDEEEFVWEQFGDYYKVTKK